jgi:hypothetical protein
MPLVKNYNYRPRLQRCYIVSLTIEHNYGPAKEIFIRIAAASPLIAGEIAEKMVSEKWRNVKTVKLNSVKDADKGKTYSTNNLNFKKNGKRF